MLPLTLGLLRCATVLGLDQDYRDAVPSTEDGGERGDAGSGGGTGPLGGGGGSGGKGGTSATGGAPSGGAGGVGAGGSMSGGGGAGAGQTGSGGSSAGQGGSAGKAATGGRGGASSGGSSGSGGSGGSSAGGSAGSSASGGAGASGGSGGGNEPIVLAGVQTGTVDLAAGSATRTATIQAVDPSRSFVVFGSAFDSTSSARSEVTGQLTGPTEVTFRRYASSSTPTIPIRYYVASFTSGVAVQRGSKVLDLATTVATLPQAVDLETSVPLVTFRNAGSLYGLDDFVRAELTAPSELSLSMYQAFGDGTVEWQVVSFNGARIERGTVNVGSADTVVSVTPTSSLDPGSTWLVVSYQVADVSDSAAEVMIRGTLDGSDRIVFERSGTGASAQLTYHAIDLGNAASVQGGARAISAAATATSLSPAVDPARSFAVASGNYQRAGATTFSTDANLGYATFNLSLDAGSELTATRTPSGSSATLSWQVVSFP